MVSLTSYGSRLKTVHIAVESIARSRVRPARFILWVSDAGFVDQLPPSLERLRRRGLEIRACPDYGPHKKQFLYASLLASHKIPLVVCDDDAIYPRQWLRGLMSAHRRHPDLVLAYRAHLVRTEGDVILPYSAWPPAVSEIASYAVMGTGVGGLLYPPLLLDAIREEGEAFIVKAPRADDVWVHYVSVRAGIRTMQIASRWRDYPQIPRTQVGTLYGRNVRDGGNDTQVRQTYGAEEIHRIAQSIPHSYVARS
ncbi:conserved hypothetical protein [uncultured Microbacterium sp.]|uniref:Glycosyltransferase n=1 Tax=uncultured Microbacterium sp. TaxID=191216 RepID=A0A1Y5NXY9_9MICO|nr:conserved hypothetical protein [uncultured Microbacterium sp.]